jgi:hypothetical protein
MSRTVGVVRMSRVLAKKSGQEMRWNKNTESLDLRNLEPL